MKISLPPGESADLSVPPGSTSRSLLKWLLRLMLGVAIVAWLISRPEGAQVGSVLRTASPWLLPISVCAYLLGQAASVKRWQLLLNASPSHTSSGAALSFGECGRIYLLGMFGNLWLPTSIGGDAARAWLAGRRIENLALATTSVFLDRFIGLLGLIFTGACGLIWHGIHFANAQSTLGQRTPTPAWRVLWLAILAVIAVGVLAVAAWWLLRLIDSGSRARGNPTSVWVRVAAKLRNLSEVLGQYGAPQHRKVLWAAFGWSIGVQAVQIAINIGLARAVGLTLPISTFAWLAPMLALSSVLPLGIAGLGVREAAAVALLQNSGATQSTVIAWSLLWQATVWLSSLPGGFLMLTGSKSTLKVL